MDTVARPHRAGIVLAVGLLGLPAAIAFLPLGTWAWFHGSRDLKAMDRGELDPSGRTLTQAGMVFGMASTAIWLLFSAWTIIILSTVVTIFERQA